MCAALLPTKRITVQRDDRRAKRNAEGLPGSSNGAPSLVSDAGT